MDNQTVQSIEVDNEIVQNILRKLDNLHQYNRKSYLANLTPESNILLSTQDIADLMHLSYNYTYRAIVSQPDFPRPVKLTAGKKSESRRWIAGEVIKYIKGKV